MNEKVEENGKSKKTAKATFMKYFNIATDVENVVEKTSSEQFMLTVFRIICYFITVCIGLALLMVWIMLLTELLDSVKFAFRLALYGSFVRAGQFILDAGVYLIWQILYLYVSFIIVKIFYIKSKAIKNYTSGYYGIRVFTMLLKTTGQTSFIFAAVMSIPGMLITMIDQPFNLFDNAFLEGLIVCFSSLIIGGLILIITQFVAEFILANIIAANNTTAIRKHLEIKED